MLRVYRALAGVVAAAIPAFSGCAANIPGPMIKMRASKDLNCPQKKIKVTRDIGGRYLAKGCQRTAVYNVACFHLDCSVAQEGEEPPPWPDRPEPGSVEEWR